MKRTRFAAKNNGGNISVPLFRDRKETMPFVMEIVGHNANSVPKVVKTGSLIPGNLFIIEGKKGTYMYQRETQKSIHGWDISTRTSYSIPKTINIVQIHMNEIYKELIG